MIYVWLVHDFCSDCEGYCSGWEDVVVFANEQVANQYAEAKYGQYWKDKGQEYANMWKRHVEVTELRTKMRTFDGEVW